MAKKSVFGSEEVKVILSHISERSMMVSRKELPAFAEGYLSSMLIKLAEISPSVRKELLADVTYIKSM